MHSRFYYLAIASLAAVAFSGCEWGGVHENTWNDGYSWADFTGTYRMVNAVIIPQSTAEEGIVEDEVLHTDGTGNGTMASSSSASGTVSPVGLRIEKGTFQMSIGPKSVQDINANGVLYCEGNSVGSVSYSTGGWSISEYLGVAGGTPITIRYHYWTKGGVPPISGEQTVPISFLNVIQQGNKFTMTGDSGMKYTGRMTSSNVGKDDYVAARTVNISFEVSSANGQRMVGTFSGVWSGASDTHYGVLSNRKLDATHSRAGNLVGVAADKSIYIYDAYSSETGPTEYTAPSNQ